MRTKEGFKLRTLGKDFILTAEGVEQVNFNKIISLNKTAAFLWNKVVGCEFTVEQLSELLVEEYGITKELADHDAAKLVENLLEAGVVEK